MPTPFDPELLLTKPLMATLGTVAADATPRTAPVWFTWEDGTLYMLGSAGNSSTQRLAANPNCSVEITDFDADGGTLLHLGLRGKARVAPNDPALFRRLLRKYLGPADAWNPWFIDNIAQIENPDGRMICLTPSSIFTNNVSYFRTGPDVIPA